ncbi:MAG: monovalent cation/H+ antiporter subunit D family protein [Verrucomicrobiota bacterium]
MAIEQQPFVLEDHLAILQVLVPLIAAPLCALIKGGRWPWRIATLVSWLCLAISMKLVFMTLEKGVLSYALGGWAPPWGIEYRVDVLNAFVLMVVSVIGAAVMSFARASVEKEVPGHKLGLFYAAYLLCLTGLLGITITGDAFNVFVFLEISSLSSYALIAMGENRRCLIASYRYLIIGTIGATFILIGIGLLYMMTGTLNMADLAQLLPEVERDRSVAYAFILIGVCLKLALYPFHFWLPNAYAYAPSAVTAFLAGTATKVSLYVLLRFFFTIFGTNFSFGVMELNQLLLILSTFAFLITSFIAIFQVNVKRILAYSSLAQIGYMTLGIGLLSVTGLTAGLLHVFNHAIMKAALFMALGCIVYRTGATRLEHMHGVGKLMPWSMAAFVIGGLSLIGVPLTVGFISKWYLILAAFEGGWGFLVVFILISSLMSVIYIWKVVEVAYFKPPAKPDVPWSEAPAGMLIPTWILILANLYFGIHTDFTVGVAQRAAEWLIGGGL